MLFHELNTIEQEAVLKIVAEQLYINDSKYCDTEDAWATASAFCKGSSTIVDPDEDDVSSCVDDAREAFKRVSLRYRKFGDHVMREVYFALYPDRSASTSISEAPKLVRRTIHVEDWMRWDDADKQIRYLLALPEHLDVYILIHGSPEAERQQP
jgi:hypothetical protein